MMSEALLHNGGEVPQSKEGFCIRCSLRKRRGVAFLTMLYTVILVGRGQGCLLFLFRFNLYLKQKSLV